MKILALLAALYSVSAFTQVSKPVFGGESGGGGNVSTNAYRDKWNATEKRIKDLLEIYKSFQPPEVVAKYDTLMKNLGSKSLTEVDPVHKALTAPDENGINREADATVIQKNSNKLVRFNIPIFASLDSCLQSKIVLHENLEWIGLEKTFDLTLTDQMETTLLIDCPKAKAIAALDNIIQVYGETWFVSDYWLKGVDSALIAKHPYLYSNVNRRDLERFTLESEELKKLNAEEKMRFREAASKSLCGTDKIFERRALQVYSKFGVPPGKVPLPEILCVPAGGLVSFEIYKHHAWGDELYPDYSLNNRTVSMDKRDRTKIKESGFNAKYTINIFPDKEEKYFTSFYTSLPVYLESFRFRTLVDSQLKFDKVFPKEEKSFTTGNIGYWVVAQ